MASFMEVASSNHQDEKNKIEINSGSAAAASSSSSRYENQKRRDWNTFGQYLRNHRPPLTLSRCSGAHVLEFLRYLDQFGKTKVHTPMCRFYGHPNPPAPCPCPLKQAWGSLDALVGRLRAAYEENGGKPEMNPFGVRAVRLYLREVRDLQSKARGVSYEKKKKRKHPAPPSSSPLPPQQLSASVQLPLLSPPPSVSGCHFANPTSCTRRVPTFQAGHPVSSTRPWRRGRFVMPPVALLRLKLAT